MSRDIHRRQMKTFFSDPRALAPPSKRLGSLSLERVLFIIFDKDRQGPPAVMWGQTEEEEKRGFFLVRKSIFFSYFLLPSWRFLIDPLVPRHHNSPGNTKGEEFYTFGALLFLGPDLVVVPFVL